MDDRYKIIVSGKMFHKEFELAPDVPRVKLGTESDCDARLRKDYFFGKIGVLFTQTEEGWSAACDADLYMASPDVAGHMLIRKLKHGDILEVYYADSDTFAFNIEYLHDFDYGNHNYNRSIEVPSKVGSFSIGAGGCNISLRDKYIHKDNIVASRSEGGLTLNIRNTTYGVYHNGYRAKDNEFIREGDFFSISDYYFYFKNSRLWTEAREDMLINGLSFEDSKIAPNYPRFVRNTRVKTVVNDEKISILDPSAKPQKPKNNLFTRLLSSFGMLVASAVMAMRGGASMLIFSGISAVMAVINTVVGFRETKKDYAKECADRIEKYNLYIEKKKNEIVKARDDERAALETIYPDIKVQLDRTERFAPQLFDRGAKDDDFISVRLGTGKVDAVREIDYKVQEKLEIEDDLAEIPAKIAEDCKKLVNAPVVVDLKKANAVGIVGDKNERNIILQNMVVDLITRQYHSDLELVFVAEAANRECVYKYRYLPHVWSDLLNTRLVVTNDDSRNVVFEYLYKELTYRSQKKEECRSIVVFFYDEYGFNNHPISKFTEKATELNATFVFFKDKAEELPIGCDYIVNVADANNATLTEAIDSSKVTGFTYTNIGEAKLRNILDVIAPVYTEEISLEGTLTKSISMFEMMGIYQVDDIDLETNWKRSQVVKSMAAPLGVSKTETVYLDLHDKAHGPHGLVAGTTGSGKSEILQTYILSMATLFHPYEVGFVIIDFKGGGMVNQFRDLPHLVGAITNIDGKEIDRSLKSIKAELQKRQRYFAEADVNHIDKYIKKFKAGEVKEPLPHLVIIVDEFAELKAEQPEFMKELISAARIGRSLGVHLILATQKPSGQVNEQIWSNSRFKLCLKVQSQEDSNEVIKSPLAAEIKEAGRAYLQVGNNEIFELFQSAYSGAPEKTDDVAVHEYSIYSILPSGKRQIVFEQKKNKSSKGGKTQLEAITDYVHDYCEKHDIRKLPDICLPSLKHVIDFKTAESADTQAITVDLGYYDDPDNQYQGEYSIDLVNNNVMIIGSSQTGKTNILQDMIRGLATKYTPKEVAIYVIDFASMVLKNYEKLNHVGGVVTTNDDEKLKNLFKLLYSEIEIRKEKLMTVGVSSYAAYKEAGETELPLIVLMIDNLSALKELYFQDDDALLNLCRDGLTVGISIVIANSQTSGIGYKYLSNFSSRIALFCNDSNEYSSLFDFCRERIDNIPGRCIVEIDKQHYECQTYLAFKGEKEIERVQEIKNFIIEANQKNRGMSVNKIPVIPSVLNKAFMVDQFSNYMEERFNIVAGLDYASVNPFVVDFANIGLLAVSGREASGKHNWVKYSVDMLNTMYDGKIKVYAVDNISKKLSFLKQNENTAVYSMLAEDSVAQIKEIESKLKERYDALVAGNENALDDAELLMMVIDNQDAVTAICNNLEALSAYKNIVGRYKNMKACIITFTENANIQYTAPEILKNIRDQRQILFFDDLSNMKLFDVPLAMSRNFKKPIELGDGYLIRGNDCVKLKTPIAGR